MLAHQIPLILGGRFDPSVIFAEMPGAWLEPRIGGMWQENTGVTPTVSGGQTIGRIADLSGNNCDAVQATAANRPVLGRRLNQITYSEDLSNAAWVLANVTNSAGKLSETAVSGAHRIRQSIGAAGVYTLSVTAKAAERTKLWMGVSDAAIAVFDLSSGVVESGSGSIRSSGVAGQYICSITDTFTTNGPFIGIYNGSVSYLGDVTKGLFIYTVDIRSTSYVTRNPIYQRILGASDYDCGQYLYASCDTNDFMTVSLPDLGGGVFSSAASVYFALPTGMSALHGQSIGTSYSAPIQSTDWYCMMVVPSRLSDQREAQLQTYFEKLAGLR